MAKQKLKINAARDLLGKRLLFVTAHPDDESFLISGTLLKNHFAEGKSCLICATYGERGKGHLSRPATPAQLKKIRREELRKVSRFLKIDKLACLGMGDCLLSRLQPELSAKIARAIKSWRPQIILSFGPDGVSGHLDHIAAGKVSLAQARKFKIPFVFFAAGPLFVKNFRLVQRRRSQGSYAPAVSHPRHGFALKADPRLKKAALAFHKSQNVFENLPKRVVHEILNYDYYRV